MEDGKEVVVEEGREVEGKGGGEGGGTEEAGTVEEREMERTYT